MSEARPSEPGQPSQSGTSGEPGQSGQSGQSGQTSGGEALPMDSLVESVARLLAVGTVVVVSAVALGTVLVLLGGHVPVSEPGPPLDIGRLVADLAAFRGDGVLWLGLLLSIGLPTARVMLALAGFARRGERRLVAISFSTLAVLGLSVTLALLTR